MQGHLNKRTCYKKPEVIYFKQKRPESVTDTERCFFIFRLYFYPAISKTSSCAVRIRKNMVNG